MSIKGYKVFNPDWTCRGFQYDVGKTFKYEGNIEMCGKGFHFCRKASACFGYYSFDSRNKVAEVEAIGLVETSGDKSVTDEIKIVREIEWQELLTIVNEGENCTGLCNTGNWNTGNRNTGDRNTGDCNTGDSNTGNWNTGDCNTGNWNTGNRNTGDRNTGDCNTGDSNTGNWNTGDCNMGTCNTGNWNTGNRNTGDRNTGDSNTGNRNTGDSNTGNRNTGDCNTGDWNTGNSNTGNRNTGYSNTGDRNTGNRNTGNRNTGNWNTGDCNTGNWNSANRSTGFFNSKKSPVYMFNKPTNVPIGHLLDERGFEVLSWNFENSWWIYSKNMTDEEKAAHPEHETAGGYLKTVGFKEACKIMWDNLDDDDRSAVMALPNFDAEVFEEITGINIKED